MRAAMSGTSRTLYVAFSLRGLDALFDLLNPLLVECQIFLCCVALTGSVADTLLLNRFEHCARLIRPLLESFRDVGADQIHKHTIAPLLELHLPAYN
jgi:hypothetical protein